jgi:hypothetical protein
MHHAKTCQEASYPLFWARLSAEWTEMATTFRPRKNLKAFPLDKQDGIYKYHPVPTNRVIHL